METYRGVRLVATNVYGEKSCHCKGEEGWRCQVGGLSVSAEVDPHETEEGAIVLARLLIDDIIRAAAQAQADDGFMPVPDPRLSIQDGGKVDLDPACLAWGVRPGKPEDPLFVKTWIFEDEAYTVVAGTDTARVIRATPQSVRDMGEHPLGGYEWRKRPGGTVKIRTFRDGMEEVVENKQGG